MGSRLRGSSMAGMRRTRLRTKALKARSWAIFVFPSRTLAAEPILEEVPTRFDILSGPPPPAPPNTL